MLHKALKGCTGAVVVEDRVEELTIGARSVGNMGASVSIDTGTYAHAMMFQLFRHSVDPKWIVYEYGPTDRSIEDVGLVRAARAMGPKARATRIKQKRIGRANLAAIARHKGGIFFVPAQRSPKRGLTQRPDRRPEVLSHEQLAERWGGSVVLPSDWQAGEALWLIDMVAPFGGADEALKELRERIFPGKKIKSLQAAPGGGVAVVEW